MPLIERFCAIDGHDFDAVRIRSALAPLLASDERGIVLVSADAGGSLTGYGVLTWGWSLETGGLEALLDELYVDDRGRGTGSALLASLLDAARAHGARGVFLETEAANERVRHFYARHGFAAESSTWMARPL